MVNIFNSVEGRMGILKKVLRAASVVWLNKINKIILRKQAVKCYIHFVPVYEKFWYNLYYGSTAWKETFHAVPFQFLRFKKG